MPWQSKPSLLEPLSAAGAVICDAPTPASGSRIYVVGGGDSELATTTVAYDTQTQSWSAIASMPTARAALAVTATPGRVHALGGWDGNTIVATHEIYRPADDAWSAAAPLPTARYVLAAATGTDGLVYALGGTDHDIVSGVALGVVEAYDPATDTWEARAPMPTKRWGLAAVSGPDGLIYALGGADFTVGYPTVEAYDPVSDTWSSRPPLPSWAVLLAAAVGPNGLIYAIGGVTDGNQTVATTYGFDPTASAAAWESCASLATPRGGLAAATGPDGLVYAIGGFNEGQHISYLDTVEAYAFSPADAVLEHGTYDIPILIGRLIGGVASDGGGGILIGNRFIPIPPRSPLMSAILHVAGPLLNQAVEERQMGRLAQNMRKASILKQIERLRLAGRPGTRS